MSAKRKPDIKPKSASAARTRAYRERMRAKGLKPVTIWTYDLSDPAVAARWRADSLALRNHPEEEAVMDWADAMRDTDGWV